MLKGSRWCPGCQDIYNIKDYQRASGHLAAECKYCRAIKNEKQKQRYAKRK